MRWLRKREPQPSNDPGRPPKGPGSVSRREPLEIRVTVVHTTEESKDEEPHP